VLIVVGSTSLSGWLGNRFEADVHVRPKAELGIGGNVDGRIERRSVDLRLNVGRAWEVACPDPSYPRRIENPHQHVHGHALSPATIRITVSPLRPRGDLVGVSIDVSLRQTPHHGVGSGDTLVSVAVVGAFTMPAPPPPPPPPPAGELSPTVPPVPAPAAAPADPAPPAPPD